jgi:predicted RNA-binding Zn ribbon-like protein
MDWPAAGDLSALVDRVLASAVDLLTHGPLDRVGSCPRCGWLFVDTSKNGRRRWCSMAVCGNREKVRRHAGPAS